MTHGLSSVPVVLVMNSNMEIATTSATPDARERAKIGGHHPAEQRSIGFVITRDVGLALKVLHIQILAIVGLEFQGSSSPKSTTPMGHGTR